MNCRVFFSSKTNLSHIGWAVMVQVRFSMRVTAKVALIEAKTNAPMAHSVRLGHLKRGSNSSGARKLSCMSTFKYHAWPTH
jgi:hypothetical protein